MTNSSFGPSLGGCGNLGLTFVCAHMWPAGIQQSSWNLAGLQFGVCLTLFGEHFESAETHSSPKAQSKENKSSLCQGYRPYLQITYSFLLSPQGCFDLSLELEQARLINFSLTSSETKWIQLPFLQKLWQGPKFKYLFDLLMTSTNQDMCVHVHMHAHMYLQLYTRAVQKLSRQLL